MKTDATTTMAALPAPIPAAVSVIGAVGCNVTQPFLVAPETAQTVLTVGTGMEFKTIGAAVAAATNGDLILVQAGTYVNDFADVTAQVTIAGAGGMVNIVATEAPPNEKGIFVVDNNCEIDNVSFQGAAIPDSEGGNAAGIRYQGGNLVLHNDSFIGNQNGILAAAVDGLAQNSVTILDSTFDMNGQSTGPNAGYTHNCYISTGISALVAQGDIFERAQVGHELKSRAASNLISGNVFYDGPTGTASYSIDLPDGGADTISGNVIEKGPQSENNAIIHFGGEGIPYGGSALNVVGNIFINDLGASATGVLNQTTENVTITGNEFGNFNPANIGSGLYTQYGNVDQNGVAIPPNTSTLFAPGTDLDDFSHDSVAHSITVTSSIGVLGGGGLLTVAAEAGHLTVVGGAGGLDFVEAPGWGGSYIATAVGASDTVVALGQDIVASFGNDQIFGGAGNLSAQVNGNATITSGSGDNAYVVNGAATLAGGGGSDTVQVNGAGASANLSGAEAYFQATVNGGTVGFNITQGGAVEQATLSGGLAAEVYNGGINVSTAGGSGGALLSFGAGTVTACFSAGADTIHAGSGSETLIVSAGAQIYAGSGTLSVFGRSESTTATIHGAAGTVFIGGDGGGIEYVGGASANTVQAALSNIALLGGAGLMSVAGGNNQTVVGGSGGVNYVTNGGADTIVTAAGAHDTVSFVSACVLTSNGTDIISAGNGNASVTANANATIAGSTGNGFYMLNAADVLNAYGYSRVTVGGGGGAANSAVTAYGSLTAVTVQSGKLTFAQKGNADHEAATITGAGATLTSSSAADMTSIVLGQHGDTAVLGGGHESVVAAGGTRVQAGAGADTVCVTAGGCIVHGGAGALTLAINDWGDQVVTAVFGGSGAITSASGYGNLVFAGGSGTANLGGMSGAETVLAGSGNITLNGGNGGTLFDAGSGTAQVVLTPGGGRVVFGSGHTSVTQAPWGQGVIYDFNAGSGGGVDVINGFRTGTDQIVLAGVTVAQQSVVAGSAHLTLSDGTQVTLTGVATVPTGAIHLQVH